jgi:hypothetical protein
MFMFMFMLLKLKLLLMFMFMLGKMPHMPGGPMLLLGYSTAL